jgi:hypothetical protein
MTPQAKPREVHVVKWMFDYTSWFNPHWDSALGGINEYKCFRVNAALDASGARYALLTVKRFMTSPKRSYYPMPLTATGTADSHSSFMSSIRGELRDACTDDGVSEKTIAKLITLLDRVADAPRRAPGPVSSADAASTAASAPGEVPGPNPPSAAAAAAAPAHPLTSPPPAPAPSPVLFGGAAAAASSAASAPGDAAASSPASAPGDVPGRNPAPASSPVLLFGAAAAAAGASAPTLPSPLPAPVTSSPAHLAGAAAMAAGAAAGVAAAAAAPAAPACPPPVKHPSELIECRVLLEQPNPRDLRPDQFKRPQLEGDKVAKIRLWKARGESFSTGVFRMGGHAKEPLDLLEAAALSYDKIEKTRPDVEAFLSEMAMVEYKENLMKTVTSALLEDQHVTWWKSYLQNDVKDCVEAATTADDEFIWPKGGGNVNAHFDVSVNPGAERTQDKEFVRLNTTHHYLENKEVPCFTYRGHKPAERDRQEAEARAVVQHRDRAHLRQKICPKLMKGNFVWVKVDRSAEDEDRCVFDLAKVEQDWTARTRDSGLSDDVWARMVTITWMYRNTPNRYDGPGFSRDVDRITNKVPKIQIPRSAIVVDDVEVKKPPNRRGHMHKITRVGLQAIRDADLNFFPRPVMNGVDSTTHGKLIYCPDYCETPRTAADGVYAAVAAQQGSFPRRGDGAENDLSSDDDDDDGDGAEEQDDEQRDCRFKQQQLLSVWRDRLHAWPQDPAGVGELVIPPEPCSVYRAMGRLGDDGERWRNRKTTTILRRFNESRSQDHMRDAVESLDLTRNGEVTESGIRGFTHLLGQAIVGKGSKASRGRKFADVLPVVYVLPDERLAGEGLKVSGWDEGSISAVLLRSAAAFLPWGASLWDIGSVCGVFQASSAALQLGVGGEDDESFVLVELVFSEWEESETIHGKLTLRNQQVEDRVLKAGTVRVVGATDDPLVDHVRKYFLEQAGRLFGGKWSIDEDGGGRSFPAKDVSGVRSLFELRCRCLPLHSNGGRNPTTVDQVDTWYATIATSGDIQTVIVSNTKQSKNNGRGRGGGQEKTDGAEAVGRGGAGGRRHNTVKEGGGGGGGVW